MNSAAAAIEKLYQLKGDDFDRRFAIMATNLKARLLEDFVAAQGMHTDVEELLGDLSAAIIQIQKAACAQATLTAAQKQDFESRLDNMAADAIIAIRDNYATFGEKSSVEFQRATATQLGVPIA